MSLLRFPFQFHKMLTRLPIQAHLPRIQRRLRSDYDAAELTPDEALLISANVAYDKAAASYLLRTSGKTAVQLVLESPRRKARPNWRRRLRTWFQSLDGSESFTSAYNRTLLPEHRKDIIDDSASYRDF